MWPTVTPFLFVSEQAGVGHCFQVMERPPSAEQSLRRQLSAFAEFTSRSLGERNLDALMLDACIRARAGLGMTHAKLLEYMPERDRLLLRSGVGWKEGYVGQYEIAPDVETPIGHAFVLAEPVPVSDYCHEAAYPYPKILEEHGCVSSLNVPLRTQDGNFGVLEVDHTEPRPFSADDIHFLTGLGNTIARAIELRRALLGMETVVDEKQLLVREMNHRIKNNLSLVAATLSLQSRRSSDDAVREGLLRAVSRIQHMALVHDRLQLFTSSAGTVNAAVHFRDVCDMLRSLLPPGVSLEQECQGTIGSDCVEPLTLIANELVTNAAKHAFSGRTSGEIQMGYQQRGAGWRFYVHDNGSGMPSQHSSSFGSQLVETLVGRMHAQLVYKNEGGTKVDVVCGDAV
jgi:two-component system, sensor histidine kinase PdtaS